MKEKRAGRVLSGKNEKRLRDAVAMLSEVLSQLGDEEDSLRTAIRGAVSLETRTATVVEIEVRKTEKGVAVITGHAAVYNQLSVPIFGFRERIRPGFFTKSIESGADVRALWQHDSALVLGRTKNNTLRLWEDERGLAFELEPSDTQLGRDATTSIQRGDVDQMSFGFTVSENIWIEKEDDMPIRELVAGELIEVSPVTWAAYPSTDVSTVLRSAPDWVQRALQTKGVDDSSTAIDPARARQSQMLKRLDLILKGA